MPRSAPRPRRRFWRATCAIEHFGGCPARIRYDNLKPAVVRVLKGRDRNEAERFIALRSHYGFASFFCIPGKDGAHEKGGVEGEIGRFRRRHLVPVPKVDSLVALNELLAAADRADDDRFITGRPMRIGKAFALEQPMLLPLPAERFDTVRLLQARVDTKARISVRQNHYSVPVRFAGRRLSVRLGATSVDVLDGAMVVASHDRSLGRYQQATSDACCPRLAGLSEPNPDVKVEQLMTNGHPAGSSASARVSAVTLIRMRSRKT